MEWISASLGLAILRAISEGSPPMRRSILLLPTCLALVAIAGCGNKGPLYYAKPTPPPLHQAPAPAPASTAAAPASASSVDTKPLSGS
jgi:predicted small lipoprotein YifL